MARAGGILVSLSIMVALVGCVGTETGNPPFAPSMGSETGVPMGVLPELTIDEGWIAVDAIALEPGPSCAEPSEGTVVRASSVALSLVGAQTFETDPVLEEGDYCALRLARSPWAMDAPAALSGQSLAIDATASDDTVVRIRSSGAGALRLTADTPFAMSPEAGGIVVFVDASLLFNGLDLTDARRQPDGTILLDETINADLLAQVEAQLPAAVALYRDLDGDGQVSAAERAETLAASVP